MKQIILAITAVLWTVYGYAQTVKEFGNAAQITPYHLEITDQKTTVILFPTSIQSVDRGSAFILAEKVKGSENVLKVKSQNKFLPQSNLSVVTADGQLYSFTVDYNASPAYQAIDLKRQPVQKAPDVVISPATLNESYLQQQAVNVFSARVFMDHKEQHHRIALELQGIYAVGDLLYFRFSLSNYSRIGYQLSTLRCYSADKKRSKRTAIQETDMAPVYQSPDLFNDLQGHKQRQFLVAFNRFTIADNKQFHIELMEQNGDRNLSLSLSGKELLKAALISGK
jgi:conjugative transposon TraN protein